MFLRSAVLTAVVAAISPSAPTTVRYRVEEKIESKIDLSGLGQGEQTQGASALWFIAVTYTDSAGGRVIHVVVDSVRVDNPMLPTSQSTIDSAKGTFWHGFLDPQWNLKSAKPSRISSLGAQFDLVLRTLHPSLRPGAERGTRWADTLDMSSKTPQADLSSMMIRNFVLSGVEGFEGVDATKLSVTTASTISGKLETPGGPAEMDGAGSGTAAYYVSQDARFLGALATTVIDAKVTIAGVPAPIPVRTTTTTTVSAIK